MTIISHHAASSYGLPVIVDDAGRVMDYGPGVKALRGHLGLTTADLAEACGVSVRTVEGWEQDRWPSRPALVIMSKLLADYEMGLHL